MRAVCIVPPTLHTHTTGHTHTPPQLWRRLDEARIGSINIAEFCDALFPGLELDVPGLRNGERSSFKSFKRIGADDPDDIDSPRVDAGEEGLIAGRFDEHRMSTVQLNGRRSTCQLQNRRGTCHGVLARMASCSDADAGADGDAATDTPDGGGRGAASEGGTGADGGRRKSLIIGAHRVSFAGAQPVDPNGGVGQIVRPKAGVVLAAPPFGQQSGGACGGGGGGGGGSATGGETASEAMRELLQAELGRMFEGVYARLDALDGKVSDIQQLQSRMRQRATPTRSSQRGGHGGVANANGSGAPGAPGAVPPQQLQFRGRTASIEQWDGEEREAAGGRGSASVDRPPPSRVRRRDAPAVEGEGSAVASAARTSCRSRGAPGAAPGAAASSSGGAADLAA